MELERHGAVCLFDLFLVGLGVDAQQSAHIK
jgi:hypothetical protein